MNKLEQAQVQNQNNLSYAGTAELWQIEQSLPNYNAYLIRLFSSFLKGKERILEFGAGIGTLAKLWEASQGQHISAVEIDPQLRVILQQRGIVSYANLDEITGCVDGIYTSNVLEHIEDDQQILNTLYSKLHPGGILIIYVPAFMLLYSNADKAIGHYRRYHKREMIKKLKNAQFHILSAKYCDSIGFFAWLFMKLTNHHSQSALNAKKLAFYDRFIFPLSNLLDRVGLRLLFGKNLFVVATK